MATVKERYPGKWYLIYKENGKKRYIRLTDVDSESEAEKYLSEFEEARTVKKFQKKGLILLKTPVEEETDLLFDEVLEEYLNHWLDARAAKTQKERLYRIKRFWLPRYTGMMLSEITPEDVLSFDSERKRAGISSTTRHNDLKVLRDIFKYAVEVKKWKGDVPIGKLPRQNRRKTDYLTPDQITLFLATCHPVYLRAACLALLNGLRLGEVLNLKKADLDLDAKTIKVRGKTESIHGTDYREIPLHKYNIALLSTLPDYYNQRLALERWYCTLLTKQEGQKNFIKRLEAQVASEYIFPGERGGQRRTFQHAHNKARENSGISHITFHGLRHTYISTALRFGGDIAGVSKSAGQSDTRVTTEIYDHLTMEAHRKIVDNIEIDLPDNITQITKGC